MTWLDGPMAGFDLETTGVDVNTDRIVTACVGYARQAGDWLPQTWLVDPGVNIPQGATDVHGVTTDYAQEHGIAPGAAIEQIDRHLHAAWATGAPVIGYNVVYDLTMLDRECRRHLGRRFELGGPVIDALVLDKAVDPFRRGSRKLTAVCEHYGIPLGDDAHDADADAFAAVRLAWTIGKHGVLPEQTNGSDGRRGNPIVIADLELHELHRQQITWYSTQRTSFFLYLARKGEKPDDPNTVWPIAPLRADTERSVA